MRVRVKLCQRDGSVQDTSVCIEQPPPELTVDTLVQRTVAELRKQCEVAHTKTEMYETEWNQYAIVGSDDLVDHRADYVLTFDASGTFTATDGNSVHDTSAGRSIIFRCVQVKTRFHGMRTSYKS